MQEISKSAVFEASSRMANPRSLWQCGRALWRRLLEAGKRPAKSLRLCDSVSLGDRRFVAVIAYRQSRFLLGATPGSLVLLAHLGDEDSEGTARADSIRADFPREPARS